MTTSFFVTDLHGKTGRYEVLLREILQKKPSFVFLGGDLLPHIRKSDWQKGQLKGDFVEDYLIPGFSRLRKQLGCNYPEVFLILGNDDHRSEEQKFAVGEEKELWKCLNNKVFKFGPYFIFGYPFVPPTPFLLKDWEKYDVSRYVDPGCVPPTEGFRTIEPDYDPEYDTIQSDLKHLTENISMEKAVFLFHSPPYKSCMDRASLDNQKFEHVPLDVHIGSIAIQRFIAEKQPYITMHGHVHESARLTGSWQEQTGRTHSYSAAHDGPELALVVFRLDDPAGAQRILLPIQDV